LRFLANIGGGMRVAFAPAAARSDDGTLDNGGPVRQRALWHEPPFRLTLRVFTSRKGYNVTQPLIVIATLVAQPGKESAVRAALEQVVPPSRAEAGCSRYELHVDNAAPGKFVMLEEWSGEAALKEHEATPHFQALAKAVDGMAKIYIEKLTKLA
jgi:quinol monooxygenase YgiN